MAKTGRGVRIRRGMDRTRGVRIARDWVARRDGEPARGEEVASPRPSRFRFWLPLVVIGVGVVFDAVTPTRFTASPFFAAAPMVAAPFFSLVGTVVIALVAIATEALLRLQDGTIGQIEAIGDLITVVTVSALALGINRIVRRSGERLASARIIAETAQRAVLPQPSERIGGLDIAARYEAAQEDAFIGGDLFAVQDTPHGVRLIVGDVRGKGMEAVGTVAVLVGAFREAAEQERTLEGVALRLDRALTREGTRRAESDPGESFATAVLAEIPRGEGVVRLVNRGHPEPMLLASAGVVRTLEPGQFALPLGMSELGGWPDRADTAPYPPGSTLLFYTDGLSEARDRNGVFYEPAGRLSGRIFPGPEELLDAVVGDVRVHTGGGSTDDMALLAVSRPAEGQPERRRIMNVVPPL
ncbi:PP2C family protein-serine/threonine phosphatase [Streptomyces fuscigenes]|uniref:PP2C family protein-serine/threonine phosphatase n=1 Tax=Streptomyces fuscigenes TaxID=1528880 RepID=UPI001F20D244|nr:PP2C family protein-serine/threonine phosphatase [Streptomyces fuscigenes]MCF3964576.1 serine/threonine-protein phosphatase [Streptomyces fuscigenes]